MLSKIATGAICAVVTMLAVFGKIAVAGPGHDHGHGLETPSADVQMRPRITTMSEMYEMVGILEHDLLIIYLDRLADTSPVVDARVELTIDGETKLAEPQPDGTYHLASSSLEKHGEKEVIASIVDGKQNDLLVGMLSDLHDGHDHGDNHKGEHKDASHTNSKTEIGVVSSHQHLSEILSQPQVLASLGLGFGILIGVFFRAHLGFLVSIAALVVVIGTGSAFAGPGHDHSGHDHGDNSNTTNGNAPRRLPDGSIFLPKPTQRLLQIRTLVLAEETARSAQRIIGRVISDPNRSGLVQSTISGRISPPKSGLPALGQVVRAGEILAYVQPGFAPIDASDVRQTQGDLEQRIAVLDARIRRQERLIKRGIASQASMQDMQIEKEGLEARRAQLAESRIQPEILKAPVDGVVAEVSVVAGQVISSADVLIHIVDPKSLWVEAISFDPRLSAGVTGARARTGDDRFLDLNFVGRSRALQQQANILHFRIKDTPDTLSIGSPVSVLIDTGETITGLIVPRNAVAQAPNGQMVVFKRLEPEKYLPSPVRIQEFDGKRVQVLAGLKAGDQIIVRNAPLVNQIR
ncbi:MAG: efflux RND transporter periplasmic adaptor subunit [Hyphomicrobiaceae bacterium]